jgi:alkanesulfonate monooxygenase SsuD/methylene tetrahydromethanopterin reductase-like flavin-dependent oxidoreductase (luciferase family)
VRTGLSAPPRLESPRGGSALAAAAKRRFRTPLARLNVIAYTRVTEARAERKNGDNIVWLTGEKGGQKFGSFARARAEEKKRESGVSSRTGDGRRARARVASLARAHGRVRNQSFRDCFRKKEGVGADDDKE